MSSTEAPISITVKTSKGSLVTVRAETAEELDQIIALGVHSIASAAAELEAAINGTPVIANTNSPLEQAVTTIAQSFGSATVVNTPAPAGSGRHCPHGKMTGIQGVGKDDRVYKGYFCPSPQGAVDKCRTQYVKENSPEWQTYVPDRIK